jgi:hypothetical protein
LEKLQTAFCTLRTFGIDTLFLKLSHAALPGFGDYLHSLCQSGDELWVDEESSGIKKHLLGRNMFHNSLSGSKSFQ